MISFPVSPVAFSRKEWSADFRQALRMRVSSEITASEFFEAFKVAVRLFLSLLLCSTRENRIV